MVPLETETEIRRLFAVEHWPVGTIATQLGVHRSVVQRVIAQATGKPAKPKRKSKLLPFEPFVREVLARYPGVGAKRIHDMARERGLRCSGSLFRAWVATLRPPRQREAFLRLHVLPAEQAQVDWAHCGTLTVGRAERKLYAFVMVLSYSRRFWVRFGFDIGMVGFLVGHQSAFGVFGGVPRVILYDNLKSAVLERIGDAIRFHPTLLAFSSHYGYEPRPVAVARGNEKGRVERTIRYIRTAFLAGREIGSLTVLNAQAERWCGQSAEERRWPQDKTLTVAQAFGVEAPSLMPLPGDLFPTDERREVRVGKTPYVRFDLNDYSVPHTLVGRTLVLLASPERVRILDGDAQVARHVRSMDRDQVIEDPSHLQALVEAKRHARRNRVQNLVVQAAPQAEQLLTLLAARGDSIGNAVAYLHKLLDQFGADDLAAAVAQAIAANRPHPHNVRLLLQKIRFERQQPEPSQQPLVRDPKLRDLVVRSHDLASYDRLAQVIPTDSADTKEPDHD